MGRWIRVLSKDIEIRVDFDDPKQLVQYRPLGETEWKNTPFHSKNFRRPDGEKEALKAVSIWLERQ